MASWRSLLIFALTLAAGHGVGGDAIASSSVAPKVKVDFYEESLCPFCGAFIRTALKDFVQSRLIDIAELRIIPSGNVIVGPDNSIYCQHGPLECAGNKLEACAVHLYPEVNKWYPYVECLTKQGMSIVDNAAKCAQDSGLDEKAIDECYEGELGEKLTRAALKETAELQPPHTYVPWLVVDGEPAYDDYENVAALVCEAYTGTKPEECEQVEIKQAHLMLRGQGQRACLRGEGAQAL